MRKMFFLAFLIGVSSCVLSSSKTADNSKIALTKANGNRVGNTSEPQKRVSKNKVNKKKREYPMIFVGSINLEDGRANAFENQIWSLAESANRYVDGEPTFETDEDEVIEVDIMNCAGYLGSAKAQYEGGNGLNWKVKFIPESVSADAPDKVKQCDANQKDDYVESGAFAIAPRDIKREKIKIAKVNTKRIFDSLPKQTREGLKNKYGSDVHKSGDISLEEDDWTDIDGDGTIDLIFVFSMYDVEHSTGVIMSLVNGKWKNVGVVRD